MQKGKSEMKEPKYKVGDWVKLHAITAKTTEQTYHVLVIYTETCEDGTQITYRLRKHNREEGITGTVTTVAEMEIEAQVGSTKD